MVVDSTQNTKSLYGHETQVGYGCAEVKSTPLMPASPMMLASRHHSSTAEIQPPFSAHTAWSNH